MKLDENILKTCQRLVMNCHCKILILDVLGEHRVFLVNDVHLKTRECRYNEVRDAQDITTLVLNVGHNFANGMTEQTLLERTQSIHKEDFKFWNGQLYVNYAYGFKSRQVYQREWKTPAGRKYLS